MNTSDLGVKIIRPHRRKPLFENSLEGSLFKKGLMGIPSTIKKVYPRKDARGNIRTGLDEDALKFNLIVDPKVRKQEQKRIEDLRKYYEASLGENLKPDSPYWEAVCGNSDDPSNPGGYALEDRDNIFDLSNPHHAVAYYWIMETGFVANSIDEIESGKVDSWVSFYVHDEATENKVKFERKKQINNARAELEKMSEVQRKRVAKIIGLPVSETASASKVYNLLDEYLETPKSQLDQNPVEVFNKIMQMSQDTINVKALVLDLLAHNVVRQKGSIIKEGETIWAKNRDEFELFLLNPVNVEILHAFMEKLESKLKTS